MGTHLPNAVARRKSLLRVIVPIMLCLMVGGFTLLTTRVLTTSAASGTTAVPKGAPATPADEELTAGSDSSITMSWDISPGATSYRIYRSTTSGAERNTPYVTTTATSYKDKNLSNKLIYYYEVSAVNAAGESARTAEDASMTPPPIGTGGNVAGVPSGNALIFYCQNALLGGFDWFQTLRGWFPQVLGSGDALSPRDRVVDMAYSTDGTMTFNHVVVSKSGLYTISWRYAFQGGLFPSVKNRQMGLKVNGTVITSTERFPITGNFNTYQYSSLQVQLHTGVNSVTMFAVSDHGLSRVDEMIVTPATASVPSAPTNLVATAGNTTVTLNWKGSRSGNPTSYTIYRGTATDGELPAPIATTSGTTTTFTDTGLHSGKTYYYNVAAHNSVGVSPDSNEVAVTTTKVGTGKTPTGTMTPGSTPTVAVTPRSTPTASGTSGQRTVLFVNNMQETVWVAATGRPLLAVSGWTLPAGDSVQISIPDGWSGRFWGRTGCVFNAAGTGKCETGDCGGKFQCGGSSGAVPATLAEFTLSAYQGLDFYDISLVDGANLPMYVNNYGGSTPDPLNADGCSAAGCTKNVLDTCPTVLQVKDASGKVIACNSACNVFQTDQYCCRGAYAVPATCNPTQWPVDYARIFKTAEPFAYSYPYDDATSTLTCKGACNYRITFGVSP